jgi:hypothetical protein
MNRLVVLLFAVIGLTSACSDDTTSPTATTTETFSGTLTQSAQNSYQFTDVNSGTVTVTATTLTPQISVGLGIGTPTGSTCTANTESPVQQAGSVTATLSAAGTFCALVYDPGGLAQPVNYVITVTHP